MNTDHIIIANLHIGLWQGKKSGLSIEDSLDKIAASAAALRTNFYDHSIPWKENGDRLMTTWIFPDFYDEHKKICLKLAEQREQFEEAYLSAVDQMEFRLVEDFKAEDFPLLKDVVSRFWIKLNLDRIATPVGVDDEGVIVDYEDLTSNRLMSDRFREAEKALREKLRKPLENFIEGFSRPKNFYESQLRGVSRMAAIVKLLNFSSDASLTELCEMVESDIGSMSMKDLRANEGARGATVASARRILHNLD